MYGEVGRLHNEQDVCNMNCKPQDDENVPDARGRSGCMAVFVQGMAVLVSSGQGNKGIM